MDLSEFNIQNSSEYFSDLEKGIIWGFTYKKGYYRSVYFLDDLYIYLLYKRFLEKNGADMSLFNIPTIIQAVWNTIVRGYYIARVRGHLPIICKLPNEDGTFDICGSRNGEDIDSCYKMEKKNGLLNLIEYKVKSNNDEPMNINITVRKKMINGEKQDDRKIMIRGYYPYDSLMSIIEDKEINCENNYIDYKKQRKKIYERYVKFIKDNGGDMELFNYSNIPYLIKNIIKKSVIKDYDDYSPIYHKRPNEDGTFDICGSRNGKFTDFCYTMTKYPDFIILTEYGINSIDSNTGKITISYIEYIMNGLNKDKKDPYIFRHPRLIPGEYKVDEFLSAALKNSENRKKHFQKRYNDFRFFIWKNDGDIDYFKNIYIQKIIMEIIDGTKNKDNKENLSPLYYRFPNQDGTFDICEWIDEDYVKESNYINKFYDNFLLTTYEINHIDWETKEATIEEKVSIISKKDGHVISAISEYKTLKGKYPYNILNDKEEFERLKQMKEDNSVYLKYGDNPFKLIK